MLNSKDYYTVIHASLGHANIPAVYHSVDKQVHIPAVYRSVNK